MSNRREFLRNGVVASAGAVIAGKTAVGAPAKKASASGSRPNIVLILADDLGFADLGCYGSEINTPNLDKLAAGGLRFRQFYNHPRCCPSRAALLSGLWSAQADVAWMAKEKPGPTDAYNGNLSPHCVTVAEALKGSGYSTAMVGKWHLTPPGEDKRNYPRQRGFDMYFGTINGGGSYYNPGTLTRDNAPIEATESFYYTDAIAINGANYIETMAKKKDPFFLYAAFTAPHFPIQGSEEDIAKTTDRYRKGWDEIRSARHKKQLELGLVKEEWGICPRDPRVPAWKDADFKEWEIRRMAVYASQIERLDRGVGRLVAKLEQLNILDNTLILFMSDNGGNYEELPGNDPKQMPGPADTTQSLGIPWGTVLNVPFRRYKHYTQEGGISSPLIVHWPAVIKKGNRMTDQVGHETDMMPTFLEVAGAQFPTKNAAGPTKTPVGQSLLSAFEGGRFTHHPIYWEHEGNRAVRDGKWKLVAGHKEPWALYDIEADRTEAHDLSARFPEKAKELQGMYETWAKMAGVLPWPVQGIGAHEPVVPDYLRYNGGHDIGKFPPLGE